MLFKGIPFHSILVLALLGSANAGELPIKSETDNYSGKVKWVCEFGGAAAGFTLMRLTLLPVDAVFKNLILPTWSPAFAANVGTVYGTGSAAMLAAATGVGIWYVGRLCKDDGSFIGALIGASLGSGLYTMASYDNEGLTTDVEPVIIAALRLVPPALAFAGYKLVPRVKTRTKSLEFDLRPRMDEHGAGAELSLRF